MIRPTTLRQIALGISLPTFAVSPAVAKATIYMPSHVAARMLGGRSAARRSADRPAEQGGRGTPHAA